MHHDNIMLHQYKAIFFPIPKVGCSSIKKICSDLLEIAPPNPEEPLSLIHKRDYPYVKKQHIWKKYKEYFCFCFVRNPWDRIVSCYKNKIHPDNNYNDPWFKNGVALPFIRYGNYFQGGMSFDDFVDAVKLIPDERADNHFKSQHRFIMDKKGNLLARYIGRFENFDEDFGHICRILGLSNIQLPHLMQGDRKNYRHYYSDLTKSIVGERFSEDIKLFGYDF